MTSDLDIAGADAQRIAALPLSERAAAYGVLLDELRRELEADGRG